MEHRGYALRRAVISWYESTARRQMGDREHLTWTEWTRGLPIERSVHHTVGGHTHPSRARNTNLKKRWAPEVYGVRLVLVLG